MICTFHIINVQLIFQKLTLMNCQITKHLSCVAFIFSAWYYAYCAQCFLNFKKEQYGGMKEIFSKEIHDDSFKKIIWCVNILVHILQHSWSNVQLEGNWEDEKLVICFFKQLFPASFIPWKNVDMLCKVRITET